MFVWSPDQFEELDPQTSKVCRQIGTIMAGNDTTCLPQTEVTQVLRSVLSLNEPQIVNSLNTLANQHLITIKDGQIDASNIFPAE